MPPQEEEKGVSSCAEPAFRGLGDIMAETFTTYIRGLTRLVGIVPVILLGINGVVLSLQMMPREFEGG